MTASLDSTESQCIRSERQVTSCRGGQVELVVWLAQMVPAMPSILGDHSRIRTGRIWRRCKIAPPPRRVRQTIVRCGCVSPSPDAREMRQNSPFAGVLPEDVRVRVLYSFKEHWSRAHDPVRAA